jgi:hypothetical protein
MADMVRANLMQRLACVALVPQPWTRARPATGG